MRGPQIMRNILQLLAEKVCCSSLLRPKRKVKGTALIASRSYRKDIADVWRPQNFKVGAVHVGKAKRIQSIGMEISCSLSQGSDVVHDYHFGNPSQSYHSTGTDTSRRRQFLSPLGSSKGAKGADALCPNCLEDVPALKELRIKDAVIRTVCNTPPLLISRATQPRRIPCLEIRGQHGEAVILEIWFDAHGPDIPPPPDRPHSTPSPGYHKHDKGD